MGALIKRKPKENLVPKLVEDNYSKPDVDVKVPSQFQRPVVGDNKVAPVKFEGDVSPDTDVVKDGVKKQMKKGKANTIMTGMFGDTSKANTYSKSLLGG